MNLKRYFTYGAIVLFWVVLVDMFATIQFSIILKIPLKPKMYIIPSLVGFIFGVGLILILHFYRKGKNLEIYKDIALTDDLTKVLSRYACRIILELEFKKYLRNKKNFSLIMLDVDDFKKINDTYGHPIGDKVLVSLVKTLKKRLRSSDSICRWGGEEFLIILPETSLKDAYELANELCKLISSSKFEYVNHLTVSMGVSSTEKGYKDVESFIKAVDEAMYEAKKSGKNMVVCK